MKETPGKLEQTGQADPLAQIHGKPMISDASSSRRYLGRIMIELYESEGHADDQMLAYTVDPALEAGLSHDTLAKRIAQAFTVRVTKTSLSGD